MSNIAYAFERWNECWPDLAEVWDAYWSEVRGAAEPEKLDPNHEFYQRLDAQGKLAVLIARAQEENLLVGFVIATVQTHHHHQHTLCGFIDAWYVRETHRKAGVGSMLLRILESYMTCRDVEYLYGGTSLQHDAARLLESLGWSETERLHVKCLEGA